MYYDEHLNILEEKAKDFIHLHWTYPSRLYEQSSYTIHAGDMFNYRHFVKLKNKSKYSWLNGDTMLTEHLSYKCAIDIIAHSLIC